VVLTERLSYAFSDPYAIGFLAGLTQVLERARISVTLLPIGLEAGEIDLTAVREASVDAITGLCLPDDHPAFTLAHARRLPVVVTHISADPEVAYVAIDDVRAGELVGRHLAELGHQRVAVVVDSFPRADAPIRPLRPEEVTCIDCQARLRGLQTALPRAELTIVSGGHNAEASGRRAAAYLFGLGLPLTAVVAMSDVLGLGVLDEVRARGLAVPDDISVTGFDDIPPAQAQGLTTLRQPIRAKGRLTAELLLDPDRADRQIVLDSELVVRTSTGPASVLSRTVSQDLGGG
jgi:DNA-binding LacI/PurR family transcriptional regulator